MLHLIFWQFLFIQLFHNWFIPHHPEMRNNWIYSMQLWKAQYSISLSLSFSIQLIQCGIIEFEFSIPLHPTISYISGCRLRLVIETKSDWDLNWRRFFFHLRDGWKSFEFKHNYRTSFDKITRSCKEKISVKWIHFFKLDMTEWLIKEANR